MQDLTLTSENKEILEKLPANEGVILFLWHDAEKRPKIVWDKVDTPMKFGRALEALVDALVSAHPDNGQKIIELVSYIVSHQAGSNTVN